MGSLLPTVAVEKKTDIAMFVFRSCSIDMNVPKVTHRWPYNQGSRRITESYPGTPPPRILFFSPLLYARPNTDIFGRTSLLAVVTSMPPPPPPPSDVFYLKCPPLRFGVSCIIITRFSMIWLDEICRATRCRTVASGLTCE